MSNKNCLSRSREIYGQKQICCTSAWPAAAFKNYTTQSVRTIYHMSKIVPKLLNSWSYAAGGKTKVDPGNQPACQLGWHRSGDHQIISNHQTGPWLHTGKEPEGILKMVYSGGTKNIFGVFFTRFYQRVYFWCIHIWCIFGNSPRCPDVNYQKKIHQMYQKYTICIELYFSTNQICPAINGWHSKARECHVIFLFPIVFIILSQETSM